MKSIKINNPQIKAAKITGICVIIGALFTSPLWFYLIYPKTENITEKNRKEDTISKKEEPKSYNVSHISITTIPIINNKVDKIIYNIRKNHDLRGLTALESGKRLSDVPNKTFSFMPSVLLEINRLYENYGAILNSKVERYKKYPDYYFEIHKYDQNDIYIITYISEEMATIISQLDGVNIKEVVAKPYPINPTDQIAVIPLNRIFASEPRTIDINKDKELDIIDLKLK